MTELVREVARGLRRVVTRLRTQRAEVRTAALALDGRRPEDARRENLEFVTSALSAAGVRFGVMRAQVATRTAVAVRSSDAPAAVSALEKAMPGEHVRARLPGHDGPVGSLSLVDALRRMRSGDRPSSLRVHLRRRDEAADLVYGDQYSCVVEFWQPHEELPGWWVAPHHNPLASALVDDEFETETSEWLGLELPVVRATLRHVTPADVTFPVDVVYLWVDGDDPEWRGRMHEHRGTTDTVGASAERFRQIEELRYSLRSLDMYAPWARRVYVVTDRQWPSWLREDDRLVRVDHSVIADDPARLPVFNSDVIVSWLAAVPGVSEQFLYMNDDFFFGRDTTPDLFFTPSGQLRVFPSSNQRPLGPVVPGEPLQESRVKLMAEAIEQRLGRRPVDIIRHTPYPLSRSTMSQLHEVMGDLVEHTRTHRFREIDDIPIEQAVHYVAEITGRAVRSTIKYGYMNITSAEGLRDLDRLVQKRDRDVFCLNDAPERPDDSIDVDRVRAALERLFPVPSRWEV